MELRGRRQFVHPNPATFNSFDHQNFCLPSHLISHITQNPCSGVGLSKLQKTCKYFFAKNKIIVCERVIHSDLNGLYCYFNYENLKRFYFNNFNNKVIKFWFIHSLNANGNYSLEMPKNIYRCTLNHLTIPNQNLTLNEINFLMDGGRIILLDLSYVNIKDEYGDIVTADKIFAKAPKIKTFFYASKNEIFTIDTLENIKLLATKSKWHRVNIGIFNWAPELSISLLLNFVRMQTSEETFYEFRLAMNNVGGYILHLSNAKNELLQNWNSEHFPDINIL